MSAYGRDRVRRGLQHFMVGKVVSAGAGFAAMVLVVRGLPVPEFAAYSVLIALVEVFTAVSGMGLTHVIMRYVPELYGTQRMAPLRAVVGVALGLRSAVLVFALLAALLAAQPLAELLALAQMLPAVKLFLVVVGLRSTAHFLSLILESTLHQGYSQLGFAAAAVARCLGMLWLLHTGQVSLLQVIALEAACDVLACLILLVGLVDVLRTAPVGMPNPTQTDRWAATQSGQMTRFAVSAYLQHLATLPFGGNTNRLVGGVLFGDKLMASFGFSLSLYDYAKRYLPTQLLIGLIRPIVVARFTESRNFCAVAKLCEQSFQINILVLLAVMLPIVVAGPELLGQLSAGKYGSDSAILLLALLLVLMLETRRLVLEVLAQTVERYDLLITSNLFLSSSVLLGIVAYPWVGAVGFPIANGLALLLANASTTRRLGRLGFHYPHDRASTWQALGIFAVCVAVGLGLKFSGVPWWLGLAAALLVYAGLFIKLQLNASVVYLKALLGRP